MTVGARIILRPKRKSLAEIAIETARITVIRPWRKHQPRKGPLAGRLPVGRQLEVEIFDAGKLPERFLKRIERAEKNQAASQQTRCPSPGHRWHPSREYHSRGRTIAILHPCATLATTQRAVSPRDRGPSRSPR